MLSSKSQSRIFSSAKKECYATVSQNLESKDAVFGQFMNINEGKLVPVINPISCPVFKTEGCYVL